MSQGYRQQYTLQYCWFPSGVICSPITVLLIHFKVDALSIFCIPPSHTCEHSHVHLTLLCEWFCARFWALKCEIQIQVPVRTELRPSDPGQLTEKHSYNKIKNNTYKTRSKITNSRQNISTGRGRRFIMGALICLVVGSPTVQHAKETLSALISGSRRLYIRATSITVMNNMLATSIYF